ncbi:MAG: hypothetical protein AAFX93_19580 [Verrucomicrobiota bacterium]
MSEETKHTPGPWKWDGIDPEWLVQSGTEESILFVVDTKDGGRIKVRDRDKPLIEAAPDLLEALEELLSSHQSYFPLEEEGMEAQDAWATRKHEAHRQAEKAIQKAKGGQSDGE